jgi:GH24 family phage-related lysozyme (muramidase)
MNSNPLPYPDQFTDPDQSPDELALQEGDIPYVYADTKGIPTIGIGINLRVSQNMAVVLSQISISGLNLLGAAAEQGQTVAQVVAAFEAVLAQNPLTPSNVVRTSRTPASKQEQTLSTALDALAAQYFGFTATQSPSGNLTAAQNFVAASNAANGANFSNFPAIFATAALGTLIGDGPTSLSGGSGSSSYGPYAINTYSQQLSTWLTNNTSSLVGASYDVPSANVPPVNSGQWEALLSAFFNQNPTQSPLIGKGLMTALQQGDVAQAWYQLRYAHAAGQSTTRRYQEAQLFGLSEPGDTVTQAIQAYEMLTEHRLTMVPYEATYGTNPNTTGNPTQPQKQISVADQNVTAFNITQNAQGNAYIQAPLNPVATLGQAFLPEAELLLTQLNAQLSNVIGVMGDLFDTTGGAISGTFNVRSTNILMAPDSTEIGEGFASVGQDNVKLTDSFASNNILIGADGVSSVNSSAISLTGGSGSDVLIGGAGSEWLIAGTGPQTLIGGQALGALLVTPAGNDTLEGGEGTDTFDFAVTTGSALVETILAYPGQSGSVEVSNGNTTPIVLGGTASSQISATGTLDSWGDQYGDQYNF